MHADNNQPSRREFIKRTTQAAAAAAVLGSGIAHGSAADDKKPDSTGGIPNRVFGKTKVKMPVLAYGGAALPKAWGNPLSFEGRVKLVRYAYDKGLRYFDTAGNYMESQSIIGKALKSVRKNVYLVSKVETTDPSKVRQAVDRSLKELQTDRLDAVLIHGTPGLEYMTVKRAMKIHAELVKLRDQRVVKFIGFSAHSYFDKALALADSGGFDFCMLAYGYLPRGTNQIFSAKMLKLREQCLASAHKRGMGIAAMKVVGAGFLGAWSGHVVPKFDKKRLGQLPASAIRYVLNDKRIDLLVVGMRLKKDIDANIKTISGDTAYTKADKTLLEDFGPKALASPAMKRMKIE
ncbi:MAG: aldo/keto reductase [Phycisphaerae bacterium]|jgi:hypothetical protein|nr:aldo/keto reductase [Phycisphaerae bacterium]